MATVDLQALSDAVALALVNARTDFETSLNRVQDVIEDIDWNKQHASVLIDEVGTVTFDSYNSVLEALKDVDLVITPTRTLLETDIDKSKKHVFESTSLDSAEAQIVNIINTAGAGEMKNLTGVYLSNAMRDALVAGQRASDGRDHNDAHTLLSRYVSANTLANEAWIDAQYARKLADRDRNIFTTLFSMAQENVKWAYGQGISIEQLHESFTARYNRLFLDITAANIAAYKAEVQGQISKFEANLKELAAQMKVEELKLSKESTEWSLKVEQANSRLGEFVKEYAGVIGTNSNLMSTRISGGKNVADGYKNIYSAYSSLYSGVSLSNSSE